MTTFISAGPRFPSETGTTPSDAFGELARRFGVGSLFCTGDVSQRAAKSPPLKALLLPALGAEEVDPMALSRWLRRSEGRWAAPTGSQQPLRLPRSIVGAEVRYLLSRGES